MKLKELLRGISILGTDADMDTEITGVSYDSRTTKPGDLFVAITGYAADGHRFIPLAAEKGAAAVLCQNLPQTEIAYVQTDDTRVALAQLSANWFGHPAEKMKMIGVTGTNGKTSVTTILKTVLEQAAGAKVGLIGTIQNKIGDTVLETERTTPESFELQKLLAQMVQAGCTHAVMEVSSHALALSRVGGIRFDVGVFTNLTEDHLDFHKTMEEYAKAKAILFQNCSHGVFNVDADYVSVMQSGAKCTVLTTSLKDPSADLFGSSLRLYADHIEMEAVWKGQKQKIILGVPGAFTAYNCLSVIGAALLLGIPMGKIAAALTQAKGVKGRMEVVPTPGADFTVLIDYAHTPDALENVLRSVRGFCSGRLIAVFGCGGDRDPLKRPIMGELGVRLSDLAVITSDNPRTEDPNAIIRDILKGVPEHAGSYTVVENRRAAICWAMDHACKDDIIVLAGKGHETYQILGTQKTHLDEREEVAKHLKEMKAQLE